MKSKMLLKLFILSVKKKKNFGFWRSDFSILGKTIQVGP